MPRDPQHQRLALACRYLSGVSMAAAGAVRAEALSLIDEMKPFPGIVAAVAGANDISLLDALEARHGPDVWMDFYFFEKDAPTALEALKLSPKVLRQVYGRAMASRPRVIETSGKHLFALGARIDSRPYISALIATSPPEPDDLLEILRQGQVMESSAFRKEALPCFDKLGEIEIDHTKAMSLSISLAERALPRSFAILAKAGQAIEVPDTLIRMSSNRTIKDMNAQLSSNHGRLRLMERLPDIPALLRPAGARLEKDIAAALEN